MPPPKKTVVFPPKQAGKRAGRRGFTLIEIALAMAVIGLLLGATVMTSRALEERRQIKMEMERLQRVSDAVVGYALRNRTRERVIKFTTREFPHVEWSFRLPAGRPYLPCPDSDGDGYEDRWPGGANGFVQGMEIKPDSTVTVTIGVIRRSFTRSPLTWIAPDESGEWEEWFPYGECRVAKGAVPWRTLGVEPSDGWGNRHTYFADIVFSNAIFGFDRQTIADRYDLRIPVAPDANLSYRVRTFLGHCPASICDGGRSKGFACARYAGLCIWGGGDYNFNRINPELVFKAGGIAEERIPPALPSSRSKHFAAGDVTDGLPFVLLSHGPNGRFAVNHWATLNDPIDDSGFMRPICNSSAWVGGADPNIFPPPRSDSVTTENIPLLYEAVNGSRLSNGTGCPYLTGVIAGADPLLNSLSTNATFFVWQPPGIGDKSDFDDLLLWKTRGELTAAIHGRIPRLPHMAIPYFPE